MKLTYKLYQQTPMIHFQAKKGECEDGLTLRPSEVKPKLDRFIRQWYKKNNDNKSVPVEWLTEYDPVKHKDKERPDHEALNYKMRIIAGTPIVSDIKNGSFFGNIGKNAKTPDYRYQVFDNSEITVEIICFINKLKELIEATIETFFLVTNFGTRQDKGFGCFVVQKNENNPYKVDELLKTWYDNRPIIKLDYKNCNNQDIDYLAEINWIYKLLKSGVNMKGDYVKSALTEYFLKDGIAGEKRALKRSGVGPAVYDKTDKDGNYYAELEMKNQQKIPKENERYIRGLFGYGEGQDWFYANKGHCKEQDIFYDKNTQKNIPKVNQNNKPVMKKNHISIKPCDGNDLKRIPSPLQFVVAEKCIYIIPMFIDKRAYGMEYKFASNYNPDYQKKEDLNCKIPSENEFNLYKFMKWFYEWLRNDKEQRKLLIKNKTFFDQREPEKPVITIGVLERK